MLLPNSQFNIHQIRVPSRPLGESPLRYWLSFKFRKHNRSFAGRAEASSFHSTGMNWPATRVSRLTLPIPLHFLIANFYPHFWLRPRHRRIPIETRTVPISKGPQAVWLSIQRSKAPSTIISTASWFLACSVFSSIHSLPWVVSEIWHSYWEMRKS